MAGEPAVTAHEESPGGILSGALPFPAEQATPAYRTKVRFTRGNVEPQRALRFDGPQPFELSMSHYDEGLFRVSGREAIWRERRL
jgi:hypothetical protein